MFSFSFLIMFSYVCVSFLLKNGSRWEKREEKGEKMKLLFDFPCGGEQLKGDAGLSSFFFFTQVTTMTNDGAEEGRWRHRIEMLAAVKFLKGAGVSPHGHRDSQGEEGVQGEEAGFHLLHSFRHVWWGSSLRKCENTHTQPRVLVKQLCFNSIFRMIICCLKHLSHQLYNRELDKLNY